MTRKTKMFTLALSLVLVVCLGVVGVLAATTQSASVTTTVNFTATDVAGSIKVEMYKKTNGTLTAIAIDGANTSITRTFTATTKAQVLSGVTLPNDVKFAGSGDNNTIVYVFTTVSTGQDAQYSFACTSTGNEDNRITTTYATTLNPTNINGITVTEGSPITGGASITNSVLPEITTGQNTVVTIVTSTLSTTAFTSTINYSFGLTLSNPNA